MVDRLEEHTFCKWCQLRYFGTAVETNRKIKTNVSKDFFCTRNIQHFLNKVNKGKEKPGAIVSLYFVKNYKGLWAANGMY